MLNGEIEKIEQSADDFSFDQSRKDDDSVASSLADESEFLGKNNQLN